jgi:magnesium transporter
MLNAYRVTGGRLDPLDREADLEAAAWIDLYAPQPGQEARVAALGIEVPTLADMEEIEVSNRLYREGDLLCMTAVLPGMSTSKAPISGPVAFILGPRRLVTVRHFAPRPFETFPARADKSASGCGSAADIFLGLIEEIVGRLADLLEGSGKSLDAISPMLFDGAGTPDPSALRDVMQKVGREGELIGRVRQSLLTLERALAFLSQSGADLPGAAAQKTHIKAQLKDIQSLEVHSDFLSARVAHLTDMTLGLVNLAQNATVRIVSVVAALFLPPTLIASAYGMNFRFMPELAKPWGYPAALGLMVLSAGLTWWWFRRKNWL